MRSPRILTVTLGTASLLAVSGVAFAVVQSVDTSPAPQVVIPTSTVHSATPRPSDDHAGTTSAGTSDDNPATHDVGDDHGGATVGSDDPATHDAGDDRGGATSGRGGSGRGSGSGTGSGGHGSDG
jgi:hypothetical protein